MRSASLSALYYLYLSLRVDNTKDKSKTNFMVRAKKSISLALFPSFGGPETGVTVFIPVLILLVAKGTI